MKLNSQVHYAHSLAGRPLDDWHKLDEHLAETANLAEAFSHPYAPGWGLLAGFWHDAGKYQHAFQERIGVDPDAHTNISVDHSSVGALIAEERGVPLLSFVIAGHHGGMPNAGDLASRLQEKQELLDSARTGGLPPHIQSQPIPRPPNWLTDRAEMSMWTRFVFSALVDADFLDTERFYAGGVQRPLGQQQSLSELKVRLEAFMLQKASAAAATDVNAMRARVLEACKSRASLTPGMFTLSVPTGGGKTLASLSFALDHAIAHGLRRVIVVIPYTSIIEQTAKSYREALGSDAVLEHHTNIDSDKETPANRLASENWDAPLVVTTSVQFFESLYANRPSRCRKLHRIAKSVVLFDEVQTFPVHLLAAVKHVLRELTQHYGATTVFCTATQPSLFPDVRELVPQPEREFAVVANRCEVLLPSKDESTNWETIAADLKTHPQVLAIVHRRDDAQILAELTGPDCLHLSARMCAEHRSSVLEDVKRRLKSGEPCRVVATQLVEAGVDVDFPEVYRAFAGADSLAQAAGRCNREGRSTGRLHVFIAPSKPPRGILRISEEIARTMWREGTLDLKKPSTFAEYFARLYSLASLDGPGVMAAEREQHFKDVSELFRMIEENGQPVVAPYGHWERRVEDVRSRGISRDRMRSLQRFMVTLYRQEIDTLLKAGAIERIADTFWAIVPGFKIYSDRWGFGWKGPVGIEPEALIA